MKLMRLLVLVTGLVCSLVAFADMGTGGDANLNSNENVNQPRVVHFRMDCRFYNHDQHSSVHHCVSDAEYSAIFANPLLYRIYNVRYGVRCDNQTLYANEGIPFSTTQPHLTTEDHIRPITSAVPKTTLLWQGALVKHGTYDAILFLDETKIVDGSCDIT